MQTLPIPSPAVKPIKLVSIRLDTCTQVRAKINTDTVDEYAEGMRDATTCFPPVVAFHDGTDYVLADGFHRVMAAQHNGFLDILAEVHLGGKTDALRYALSANARHGLRRTNADKRRSVELALAEWPKLSDVELGRICAVGKTLVGEVRREVQPVEKTGSETRIGHDGKERKMPKREAEVEPQPEPEDPPQVIAHTEVMATKAVTPTEEEERREAEEAKREAELKALVQKFYSELSSRFAPAEVNYAACMLYQLVTRKGA